MEVVLKGSQTALESAAKSWSLDHCLSPSHFLGLEDDPSQVASTRFEKTKLAQPYDSKSSTQPTGDAVTLPSNLVFRSIGYKSTPLPGFAEAGIQFDNRRGIVENDGLGRVTRLVSNERAGHESLEQVPGVYCAGWVKRGPTGVIASTMEDAFATGDAIAKDWLSGVAFLHNDQEPRGAWEGLVSELDNPSTSAVSWEQWRKIDAAEREKGRELGKAREKFRSAKAMLSVLS